MGTGDREKGSRDEGGSIEEREGAPPLSVLQLSVTL